ncbi:peptidase [Arthrobacter sp. H35-D1]|uniref:peptidase n=1 Tax=Arthrobacter sp. H35-D1 TaxID=3046202 RepID=UPI0024BAF7DE|nr:peptidase [Arthrobacter sp. H35-D1]MDJ0314195.1 peptidase [Arthrobacter sp. H35-D1]
MRYSREGQNLLASIPGHGTFTVTAEAVSMIDVFGGVLHCYQGCGGCRKQGLYFSRTEPKKLLRCLLNGPEQAGGDTDDDWGLPTGEEILISVSHELAAKLDGAVLDFGQYNKIQRFAWLTMPAVKGPACTCRRSIGPSAGKRSPCLDDQRIGLTDL